MDEEGTATFCLCGCSIKLHGSRRYYPGHKPKRERLTPEERSEKLSRAAEARWKKHREQNPPKPLNDCACGCGEKVKGTWAWGHHSRVDNISKRSDVREKRSEMFKRLHAEGRYGEAWNKGKTKDDDERIAQYGNSIAKAWTPERREKSAETMKQNRLSGVVPSLSGSSHPQWQGGTSSITQRVRGNIRLYELWKRPILVRDGFKCIRCGSGQELVVHHDGQRFAEIVKEVLSGLYPDAGSRELTWDEQTRVADEVIEYHIRRDVSGVTLCWGCHEKEHENDE